MSNITTIEELGDHNNKIRLAKQAMAAKSLKKGSRHLMKMVDRHMNDNQKIL